MKWRKHTTSIVLAAIALALGVWIWMDRASVTDTERGLRPKNVLSAFRRDALSRIEINKAAEKLVLSRDVDRDADAAWRLESPEVGLADPNAVEQLTSAFEFATFVRKVEPKSAPTFDSPRASGMIAMGKLVYKFALGAAAPTPEGAAYFKVEGEGVYVVAKELVEKLLAPASTYRSRTLVPYLSLDLASLDIHTKAGDLRIERTGELTFKIAGSGIRASREALDKVWSAFSEMRAETFTNEDVADAVITIAMTPKDGRPRGELRVGGPCRDHPDDVIVVRTAPTRLAACAPKGIIEGLSMTADELADTRLFFAHEDEIEEVTLTSATSDAKIELARKGSGWHARAPFDRDLAGDEVDAANALASAVVRAKGTHVVKYPAGEPFIALAHVRVKGGEMQGDELVDVAPGPDHVWFARRLSDDARLEISPEVERRLVPSKSALKGKDVIAPALDPKDVASISLRCGTAQDITRDGNAWKLASPAGYTADQAGALDVVDQIARLRADAWVADADDGSFGFSTTSCAVTLGTRDGARHVKLQLGRDGETGVYAMVTDTRGAALTSPVFLEPRLFHDALARILIDKSALAIESSKATTLALSRPGVRVTLRRVADRFVGPDAGLPVGIETVTSALDALRADDVVRLGPPAPEEGFGAPSLEVRVDDKLRLVLGRDVLRKNQAMVFARTPGVDATFAIARERVDPLRSAL